MPQAPSTRWCPTPEQLMILEEMYRSGVRTPNASQIQHITAHLSYYGKIEGKNVFYWFQNHKARDRQKMRRRLSRHQQLLQHNGAAQPHPQIFQMEPPNPSLHPPPQFSFQHPPHLHQGSYHENSSVVNPGMNLVCKLETWGKEGEAERSSSTMATSSSTSGNFVDWTTTVDMGTTVSLPPCCRPLKTLDLFPTNSTSLKDEFCSTSKSSSCSTSTTN